MKLWLDDIRPAPEGWIWCKGPYEAIGYLSCNVVDEISFDHDLGDDTLSGYDVACKIEGFAHRKDILPLRWAIHSANPIGRDRIRQAMESAERFWNKI